MARSKERGISGAAGLSGGTGFAGIVMLLPETIYKSILLILAPAITVLISKLWDVLTQEIDARFADWRIRQQKDAAQALYERLKNDPSTAPTIVEEAKKNLDALNLIEVGVTKRRVEAIVTS